MTNQQLANKATHAQFFTLDKIHKADYRYSKLTNGRNYKITKRENGEFCIIDDIGGEFWSVFCIIPESESWGMFTPIL